MVYHLGHTDIRPVAFKLFIKFKTCREIRKKQCTHQIIINLPVIHSLQLSHHFCFSLLNCSQENNCRPNHFLTFILLIFSSLHSLNALLPFKANNKHDSFFETKLVIAGHYHYHLYTMQNVHMIEPNKQITDPLQCNIRSGKFTRTNVCIVFQFSHLFHKSTECTLGSHE